MIESIDHVNLVVADLEAMTRFYRDVLGLTLTKDVTISGAWIGKVVGLADVEARVRYLELPTGPRIELIGYVTPRSLPVEDRAAPHRYGLRHLAFRVGDIDTLVARLAAAGVRFFSEVQQVPDGQVRYAGGVRKRLVYFTDPEGNLLELCEYKAA